MKNCFKKLKLTFGGMLDTKNVDLHLELGDPVILLGSQLLQ